MLKWLIFIFFIFFQIDSHTQSLSDVGFEAKKKYTLQRNNKDVVKSKDYIILKEDTLENSKSDVVIKNLETFCECFNDLSYLTRYGNSIQFVTSKNKGKPFAEQWNSKIIYYLDRRIPRKVRKDFKIFTDQFIGIDNLVISSTKKYKNSNLYITTTKQTEVKDSLFNSDSPYSLIKAEMFRDKNYKMFGGIIEINEEVFENRELTLRKLKQMFFFSLGIFRANKTAPEDSLLSYEYMHEELMSEFDLKILKTHYYKIYPQPLTYNHLFDLNSIARKICKK